MNSESIVMVKADRNQGIVSVAVAAAVAATLLLASPAHAAGGGPYKPSNAVKFEKIEGTHIKRVILTEKAVERLGIETGEITKETIVRTQLLGGTVIMPVEYQPKAIAASSSPGSDGGTTLVSKAAEDSDKDWIMVTLSEGEWARMGQDKNVRVLPLGTREGKAIEAEPAGLAPYTDTTRTMLRAFYVVKGKQLKLNERVRVEVKLKDSDQMRMVAPYKAVHYDGKGKAWAYVETTPMTYERKPLEIERIEGKWAVLSDGPQLGTKVVTTGSPLLYGAEVIFKR